MSGLWWRRISPQVTLGLLLISVYLIIIAIGNIFGLFDSLVKRNLFTAVGAAASILLYGIPAYGILKLRPWARTFEIIFSIIFVLLGFILMFLYSLGMGAFIVVSHGLIAVYLLTDKCRRAFGLMP